MKTYVFAIVATLALASCASTQTVSPQRPTKLLLEVRDEAPLIASVYEDAAVVAPGRTCPQAITRLATLVAIGAQVNAETRVALARAITGAVPCEEGLKEIAVAANKPAPQKPSAPRPAQPPPSPSPSTSQVMVDSPGSTQGSGGVAPAPVAAPSTAAAPAEPPK